MEPTEKREFAADDLSAALAHIDAMPDYIRRIQVEVWTVAGWQFVYGDDRVHVAKLLGAVVRDRPFRLRGLDVIMNDDSPTFPDLHSRS